MYDPIIFNPIDQKEREKILKFLAALEHERGQERLKNGQRQPFPYNSIDAAIAYYIGNDRDGGRYGRALEVMVRYYLTGQIEPVHPQGAGDVRYSGNTLEVKSSAGTLTPYIYRSPEDVQALYNSNVPTMARARYIVYTPFPETVSLQTVGIVRVYTQCRFLQAAEKCGNLVIRSKKGLFGLGLRQFYQSNRQTERWLDALDDVPSISLNEFFTRHAKKEEG